MLSKLISIFFTVILTKNVEIYKKYKNIFINFYIKLL